VTLHCSDGWDRTAQLSSLAQIFLDPYFRTTTGLQILIEKEWLSFGTAFPTIRRDEAPSHVSRVCPSFVQVTSSLPAAAMETRTTRTRNARQSSCRYAHAHAHTHTRTHYSSCFCFVQFIDCVWQLTQQYPCIFEFNERFLIAILEHLYSCRFGTFLCDTEKQRVHQRLKEKTVSLWSYTNCDQNRREFLNPFYVPDTSVLFPDTSFLSLALWKGYYMRYRILSALS
jgi:hypothetical protein